MHHDATVPTTPRERLAAWLAHLEHVLPAQAPIRNFVHHNTLHGLQHLPFPEALAEARRLSGAQPWLAEERCRTLLAAGRITVDDLDAAFDEAGVDGLDAEVLPGMRRRDILRLGFVHDLAPVSAARRDWLLAEGGALARLADGVSAAARARLLSGAAAPVVLGDLWQASAEVLGLAPSPTPANGLASLFAMAGEDDEDDARWQFAARALWSVLVGRLGREWTLSALLERLTGESVFAEVQTMLIRHLSAHLDLGMASWRNPQRAAGFYAAWRASAGVDLGWELDEWLAARDEIARLPDDPLETIERELMHLGPDETHWGDYLERIALELPGWSGMFLWRDRHAGHGGGDEAPVAMADYLAVRLVLERICCEELVHRIWGLPLFLSELGDHFLLHPAELKVRHDFFAGLLGEAEAHEARRLIAGDAEAGDWERLAARIAPPRTEPARRQWPLFLLAQHLGLDGAALRAAGREGATNLLDALDELDADRRGFVWLLAYERRYRERIFAALAANHGRGEPPPAPAAQLVFCMDDREEGTRRHLEEVNPAIETFGAAGFFGVPMYWVGLDDAVPTALCPVVVTPANEVREVAAAGEETRLAAHRSRRALRREWQERLHRATRDGSATAPLLTALAAPFGAAAMALQSLAPAYLGDLLQRRREAFDRPVATEVALSGGGAALSGGARSGFTDDEQIERVAAFLGSIGLTQRFAPLVAIVGHGSNSLNNPHAAAYDCGACSGRHGGPNARVFAAMANRPEVRAGLAARGIAVPDDTWFLGCEHNTGDEAIAWYDLDRLPAARQRDFDALVRDLGEATRRHAVERCRRFASAPSSPTPARALRHLLGRRHDWSQARPELGHATVASAFIGRRALSRGAFFDRRAFLISYDPRGDDDGRVLEGILLAAGPVGAGICLEYYFSTVDNRRFGCGSKVTHNLAGLFGVMEGASSDLRTGLPLQMIEIHEPMRLLVVIEQTRDTVAAIYARQPPLRELIGNGWIVVAVKEPGEGGIFRFDPACGWLPWSPAADAAVPRARDSASWLGGQREPLWPALLDPEAAT
jgi:uncharacterized protein